jgi:hypothetical protein
VVSRATVLVAAVLAACSDAPAPAAEGAPEPEPAAPPVRVASLVDTAMSPAVGGEDGWSYWRTAVADLDGDGREERVVVTARVETYRGRPAWDDGQPWQVYVEEEDGRRTYVYARFVQLGTVTLRLGTPEDGRASVVLLEHLPDRLGVYEVAYEGPGRATAAVRFERALDPAGELAGPALP